MSASRRMSLALVLPLAALIAIQFVPYGRDHSVPAAGAAPAWDSPRTLELAKRACFDCHSNQTRWPWYSHLAPLSWRIQNHVDEGREKLDFTNFRPQLEEMAEAAGEAAETVTKQEMPPFDYKLAHAEARLTPAERDELARGLAATFAAFAEKEGGGGRGGESGEAGEAGESEHGRGRGRGERR